MGYKKAKPLIRLYYLCNTKPKHQNLAEHKIYNE